VPSVDYDPERDADRDLFAALGAAWEADAATLRQAWRTAGRAAHPDAGGSHDDFIAVQHAWQVLSDPTRRTRYVRAYEARHGPQGRRAGTGRSGNRARDGGPTRGRTRRASPGPIRPRCAGFTLAGMPCGNRAAEGSDRCWQHADTDTPDPTTPRPDAHRTPWRCDDLIRSQGFDLPCHYNRLVGETHCWDHATEAQRRAALMRVDPGRCAAMTQRGRPCSNRASWLGFPLCDNHLTVGVFTTYDRQAPRPRPRPQSTPGPDPPSSTEPPRQAAPPVVLRCPACGRRNRVRAVGRLRCGTCQADLLTARVAPTPDPRPRTDSRPPSRAAPADPPPTPSAPAETTPNRPPAPPRTPPPPSTPSPPRSTSRPRATAPTGSATPAPRPAGSTSTTTVAPRVHPRSTTGPGEAHQASVPQAFTATVRPRQPRPAPTDQAHHPALAVLAALGVLLAGVVGVHRWQENRPVTIAFDEDIKATSARCASGEALTREDVLAGFEMTCVMVDASPGNRDRPYVQVRLDGCADWHRLDHDDNPEPVVITTGLAPCGPEPDTLEWQVCQTHGGLLPDDCDDGSTDLPSG